jgi:hypothetical protein
MKKFEKNNLELNVDDFTGILGAGWASHNEVNILDCFKSAVPGINEINIADCFKSALPPCTLVSLQKSMRALPPVKTFTSKTLVENWLSALRKAFNNPESGLYGHERRYKSTAEYWLKHGRHNPACSDPDTANAQRLWNSYIKKFARVKKVEDDYVEKIVRLA